MRTLKEGLQKWTDTFYSQVALAISLGLMEPSAGYYDAVKNAFKSDDPIGKMLRDILMRLVEVGVLKYREREDSEDEYRWNASFIGSWEKQTPPDYLFPSIRPETLKAFLSTWKEDLGSVQFALAQSLGLMSLTTISAIPSMFFIPIILLDICYTIS